MSQISYSGFWKNGFAVNLNSHHKFNIGALSLYVSHYENEWQIRHEHMTQNEEQEKKLTSTELKQLPAFNGQMARIIYASKGENDASQNPNEIKFQPCLANRSIVAKPHTPFLLPAGESITVYISSPVWLGIKVGSQIKNTIELPTYKLSDTWFGPRPHLGELCYASRFSGRTNLNLLPKRMSRIITPVDISNNGNDNLKIEKIAIPTAYLSVYLTEDGQLWTSELKVVRENGKKDSQVTISKNLPSSFSEAKLITEAREQDSSGLIGKTLDRLFL